MDVTLTIQADALSAEALQDLTRDLSRTLNREADVRAAPVEVPAGPGARAAGLEQSSVLVQIFAHGTGVVVGETILLLLRPYFERLPSLLIKARGPRGREVTVGAQSLQPERLQQTVGDIRAVLEGQA